jgi:hypothetical protein
MGAETWSVLMWTVQDDGVLGFLTVSQCEEAHAVASRCLNVSCVCEFIGACELHSLMACVAPENYKMRM